jgi:putative transposase
LKQWEPKVLLRNDPDQLKRIRELEKENKTLKEIIIEKELEGKLKDELLKRNLPWRKKRS